LLAHLPEADAARDIDRFLERIRDSDSERLWIQVLEPLTAHLRDRRVAGILVELLAPERANLRRGPLNVLAAYLSDAALDRALDTTGVKTDLAARLRALVDLAAVLAPHRRGRIIDYVLATLDGLSDEAARAPLLVDIAGLQTGSVRELTLRNALASARRITDADVRRRCLERLAGQLKLLSDSSLRSMFDDIMPLLAQRSRKDLLVDLRVLAPLIHRADPAATREMFDAIVDVGRWWP
jgi:hypothetical protein